MKQKITIEHSYKGKMLKTETKIVDTVRRIKVGEGTQDLLNGDNKKTITKSKLL